MFFNKRKYRQLSDSELILKYRETTNEMSITILYERYSHLVFGACLNYLKQKEDAEDVTIKLFASLGEKISKHEISHFKSWLYQVTRNDCLQVLRSKKSRDTVMIEDLGRAIVSLENDFQPKEQILSLLESGIDHLKNEQRECIERFYLKDQTYNEIAEELSITLNAVKSAVQNGKRNLKIWMENHGKTKETIREII